MEENEKKRFGKTVKGTAEVVVLAYVLTQAVKGLGLMIVDASHFVRARKANKATEES